MLFYGASTISKLKISLDDEFDMAKITEFALDIERTVLGKGENAGYQHFSPFPKLFSKAFFLKGVKSLDDVVQG